MAPKSWHASVIDAPGSEPFAVVGDLIVAVRTPRSRDFVTMEVAQASRMHPPPSFGGLTTSSRPLPVFDHAWSGEVRPQFPVLLDVEGTFYTLTLDRLADSPDGPPWVVCDVHIECD